jgi:hypothetical protein
MIHYQRMDMRGESLTIDRELVVDLRVLSRWALKNGGMTLGVRHPSTFADVRTSHDGD